MAVVTSSCQVLALGSTDHSWLNFFSLYTLTPVWRAPELGSIRKMPGTEGNSAGGLELSELQYSVLRIGTLGSKLVREIQVLGDVDMRHRGDQ